MEANNVKAMREALEDSQSLLESFSRGEYGAQVREQMRDNRAALSAPPRNCNRFETAEDAKREFNYLWNFVWKRGGGCVDEREYWSEYEKWLFAPIQKGGNDGNK